MIKFYRLPDDEDDNPNDSIPDPLPVPPQK